MRSDLVSLSMLTHCPHSDGERTVLGTLSPFDCVLVAVMPAGSHEKDMVDTIRDTLQYAQWLCRLWLGNTCTALLNKWVGLWNYPNTCTARPAHGPCTILPASGHIVIVLMHLQVHLSKNCTPALGAQGPPNNSDWAGRDGRATHRLEKPVTKQQRSHKLSKENNNSARAQLSFPMPATQAQRNLRDQPAVYIAKPPPPPSIPTPPCGHMGGTCTTDGDCLARKIRLDATPRNPTHIQG